MNRITKELEEIRQDICPTKPRNENRQEKMKEESSRTSYFSQSFVVYFFRPSLQLPLTLQTEWLGYCLQRWLYLKFHSRISGNKEEADEGSAPLTSKQDGDCSSGNWNSTNKGVEREEVTQEEMSTRDKLKRPIFRHLNYFCCFLKRRLQYITKETNLL